MTNVNPLRLPEFLESKCAKLPRKRSDAIDFPVYLDSIFTDFTEKLKLVTGNDPLTVAIRENVFTVESIGRDVVQCGV